MISKTAFISDLHLSRDNSHTVDLFLHFINKLSVNLHTLYILGDLFEYWLGDDDDTAFNQRIIQALFKCGQRGTQIYIMHGNRDLLLGKRFAKQINAEILSDPCMIMLYGTKTVLSHGDLLCTDDVDYQRYRRYAHNPILQYAFLKLPLWIRRRLMDYGRNCSHKQQGHKSLAIMDTNQSAIETMLSRYKANVLIHGHTHHPNLHYFQLIDRYVTRIVLSDWDKQGNVLLCSENGDRELRYFDLSDGTPL